MSIYQVLFLLITEAVSPSSRLLPAMCVQCGFRESVGAAVRFWPIGGTRRKDREVFKMMGEGGREGEDKGWYTRGLLTLRGYAE